MLARSLCIAFIFVFITFMSIGGFPSFIEDMKVFQRERLNGHYGVAAFIISNTLSAMPFLMMISFFSTTICHSVLGSQQGYTYYLYFFVGFYVNILVVESLMMAIASVVPNFLMGVIVGAGIQAIFILICGFFQLPNDIPKVFGRYPITHISFYYWSFQGQSKNHFQGLVINNESLFFREFRKISGDYLLQNILQINVHRSKWVDLAVTCSMVAIYRIIFFVMIKISDDVTNSMGQRLHCEEKAREGEEKKLKWCMAGLY